MTFMRTWRFITLMLACFSLSLSMTHRRLAEVTVLIAFILWRIMLDRNQQILTQ